VAAAAATSSDRLPFSSFTLSAAAGPASPLIPGAVAVFRIPASRANSLERNEFRSTLFAIPGVKSLVLRYYVAKNAPPAVTAVLRYRQQHLDELDYVEFICALQEMDDSLNAMAVHG
jgi:hypothetical protein